MDQADIEGTAESLLRSAGVDVDEAVWTPRVAVALLGPGCIERVDRARMRGEGALARVGDSWRIFVRRGLEPERTAFIVGHELGHWACQRAGYWGEDLEDVCDRISGALCLPRVYFRTLVRELGPNMPAVARQAHQTETACWLRYGEVIGPPLALVAPARVRVRGEPYGWPETEPQLRALASSPARPGLRKTKLRDDKRRTAIVAETG